MRTPWSSISFPAHELALKADELALPNSGQQKSNADALAEAGRALLGVFLVGALMWGALIMGIRAVIEALP